MLVNHLNDSELEKKIVALTSSYNLENHFSFDNIVMDYKEKLDMKTGRNLRYWIKDFILPVNVQSFNYKFHILTKNNEEEFQCERDYTREFSFRSFYNNQQLSEKGSLSHYKIKENTFVQINLKFKNSFSFNQITDNLFIGKPILLISMILIFNRLLSLL